MQTNITTYYDKIKTLCIEKKPLEELITALNKYIKLFPNSSDATQYLTAALHHVVNVDHRTNWSIILRRH